MAIQYYMRAFNTTLVRYVDWVVNDAPDSTGTFSGFPTNQLINITVNRVVQSKVANFLKPNQSLGGTDGEFFHVNSYDWKNATAPIPPPTVLTGFAVERGITSVTSVSNASNASPIVITSSSNHNLVTGQLVTINGVTGNVNANGTWPIIVLGLTTFSLTGSTGSGAYISGGNIFTPSDFSTLIWDEPNNVWRFVFNTKGDGTTLGASQSVKINNLLIDGYEALGTNPAQQGIIRLPNNQYIFARSSSGLLDIQLIGADTFNTPTGSNRIKLGGLSTDVVYTPGIIDVDGYVQHDGSLGNVAQSGFIREQNNTTIVAFRTQSGLLDIAALSSNAANNVILGDAVNPGVVFNTSTGSVHQFQVNSVPDFEIGNTFARFTSTVTLPTILQTTTAVANATGQTLVVQAQNSTTGTTIGGILSLTSGTGTVANGTVDLSTGGNLKVRIFPATGVGTSNNSIQYFDNLFRVDTAQTNPVFRQDDSNSLTTGNIYTVQAQNTTTVSSVGGVLALTSGTGTTNAGQVQVQTGGVTQIIVSPLTIPPGGQTPTVGTVIIRGNLEVVGTTTTIDSTIVDIVGPIIHANWTDPAVSAPSAVPAKVVGYSVHRGNTGIAPAGIPRDGAALIWTEGTLASGADGYWRHVTYPGDGVGTDNFTIANSLNAVGTMANDFAASSDPNPILGFLASTGSFRAANNVPTVVGRSNQATTTLTGAPLVNGTFTLPFVAATVTVIDTTNFTTSGSLLVQSSAGSQTVTYTGKTGTTFTGVNGGTGTIVTGGIVAQTNNATTFNGANGTAATTATITVPSTTGFPTAGTLRIVSHTANAATAPVFVQTITYTGGGGGGTSFTGCSGAASGFLFVGDAITSVPSPGISDLPLVSTDFGNRVLHGFSTSPTGNVINNTGHIFNTPTGFLYDFQVNSVTQVRLGEADTDASGFAETIEIGPTVSNPRLVQQTLPNTGATNGFNLGVFAQAGQLQTGGNANNNGGLLVLSSGAQGLGGAGAVGIDGYVELRTGFTSKVRVFPTVALSAADNNSILYFENLFRVDTAQLTPRFRQDDKTANGGTGETFTIQAQNETGTTSNGGQLTLTSGTGTTAHGNVNIQTGSATRVLVTTSFTAFNDSTAAEALRITPVSTGTTQITYAIGVTSAQINQTQTTTANGAPMTIQSQVTTLNAGTGGALSVIAGNATGTTTTGGALNLASGSGTTTNGIINFQPGGTTQILITATGQFLQWVSTMANPTLNQVTTGGASGTTLTVQAQNAATTGGNLTLTSGTATTAGDVNIQTGAVSRVIVHPTFTEFRDAAEALRITPVSAGNTQITFAATDTAATINQTLTAATPSATMTIQSQVTTAASGQGGNLTLIAGNATGTTATGGNAILTSGTGTTVAGNVQLQTGAVDRVVVHPTFTEFRDTAEAYRITPVSAGTTTLQAASTVTALTYRQADLAANGGTGATTTLQAQNETGTTSNGGLLVLTSGTGTTTAGNVSIQTGAVDKIIVHPAFTEFRDTAEALRITPVSAGTTQITFASTDTAAQVNQTTTAGATGATMTVQAQNAVTTGGSLNLTSGTGVTAGDVNLQVGGVTNASVTDSKFVFNKGKRRNIVPVTGTYAVLSSDDYLAITTLAAPFTITLPATPTTGDEYLIKDTTGNAGTQTVTVDGNGNNIDGSPTAVLNAAYAAATFTYTGTQWSIT